MVGFSSSSAAHSENLYEEITFCLKLCKHIYLLHFIALQWILVKGFKVYSFQLEPRKCPVLLFFVINSRGSRFQAPSPELNPDSQFCFPTTKPKMSLKQKGLFFGGVQKDS
jgi:hypothetical protein